MREFYYDDDVVDVADWMTLTRGGSDLMTHQQDGYVTACHVRSASATSQADATADSGDAVSATADSDSGALQSGSADRTITADSVGQTPDSPHSVNALDLNGKCEEDCSTSSVTVESDASGFHTITCNKTDVATGDKRTTYQATVKAAHVVTRVIVDDDVDVV